MKTIITNMTLLICLTLSQLAPLNVQADVGPGGGNGGDNVEPLFINAKKETVSILSELTTENVDSLNIDVPYKNWLKAAANLSRLQYYANAMLLSFQDGPCNENKKPRSTSYFTDKNGIPKMCISYSYNRETTPEQAIALVIHEAGHFAGEKNHIFLSGLGEAITSQNSEPEETYTGDSFELPALLTSCGLRYKNCLVTNRESYHVVVTGTNRSLPDSATSLCEISELYSDHHHGIVVWITDLTKGSEGSSGPHNLVENGKQIQDLPQGIAYVQRQYIDKGVCGKYKLL